MGRPAGEKPTDLRKWGKASKPNGSGRSKGDRAHLRLYHHVMETPAWGSLSPGAVAVLLALCRRHNGMNNGGISLSCREAAATCNVSPNSAGKYLAELEARGFIIKRRASAFSVKTRRAAEYEITLFPCNGQPARMTFVTWRPDGAA